jgi:hypothetical protein
MSSPVSRNVPASLLSLFWTPMFNEAKWFSLRNALQSSALIESSDLEREVMRKLDRLGCIYPKKLLATIKGDTFQNQARLLTDGLYIGLHLPPGRKLEWEIKGN